MTTKTYPPVRRRHVVKNVQALRAIAVLLVVLLHIQLPQNGIDFSVHPILRPFNAFGKAGVDLFFVISGFIMLVTNWEHFGQAGASSRFIAHRIVRIYPPYWLALVPILFVFLFARDQLMAGHTSSNTDLLASVFLYPEPVNKTLFPLAWTLTFEMTFYAIFSVLLLMKRHAVLPVVLTWAAIQIVLFLLFGSSSNPYFRYLGNLQPLEFLFGIVVGLTYVHNRMPYARVLFSIGVASGIAVCWYAANRQGLPLYLDRVAAFGVPSALLLYGAVSFEKSGFMTAPSWCVAIGNTSYATYLWHFSLIAIARRSLTRVHPFGRITEVFIIISVLLFIQLFACLVYKLFELPVTRTLNSLTAKFLFRSNLSAPQDFKINAAS